MIQAMALSPNGFSDASQTVYAFGEGGKRNFRSVDGGNNWTDLGIGVGDQGNPKREYFIAPNNPWGVNSTTRSYLSVAVLAFNPKNASELWLAEGMGLWHSTNISAGQDTPTFKFDSTGIEELVANDIVSIPNSGIMVANWDRLGFHFPSYDSLNSSPNNQYSRTTLTALGV